MELLFVDGRSPGAIAVEEAIIQAMPDQKDIFAALFTRLRNVLASDSPNTQLKVIANNVNPYQPEYEGLRIIYLRRIGPNPQRVYAAEINAKNFLDEISLKQLGIAPSTKIVTLLGNCTKQTQIKMLQEFVNAPKKFIKGAVQS